uniref:Variant surface glycoprotein Buteba 5 n=1 Tax=Trypanosoma brucei brucei TaxID=5702 RepID=Q571W4_TRYBB|nr:variant surface glycoprotein Buteba 5 [Trypanosoma brucei brucei]
MPKATYALVVQTLLLVSKVHQVQPTAGDAIKKKYWTALCDIAVDADKIAAKALHNLQQPATPGAESLRNLLRALVYNLANNTEPTSPGERMIWSHFAEEASAAIDFYKGDKPAKLITAVRDAARANGAILDWINTQHKVSTSSHGCLSGGDSGEAPAAGSAGMATIDAKCVPNWTAVTAEAAATTAVGLQGLQGTLGGQKGEGELANGGHGCNSNSANSAVKLLNGGTGTSVAGQSPTLVAGHIQTNGHEHGDGRPKQCCHQANDAPVRLSHSTGSKNCGRNPSNRRREHDRQGKNQQFVQECSTCAFVRDQSNGQQEGHGDPRQNTSSVRQSRQVYSNLYKNVDEMPLTNELTHDPNLKKLGDITDINDLMRLYFFFLDRLKSHVKDLTAQLEEAKRQQSPKSAKEKEKECHTKGQDKQEECEKLESQGCVFNKDGKDGEKCTLKKEVETELEKATTSEEGKDGKATNTTGSNSFVIKKSFLFLAFLLF